MQASVRSFVLMVFLPVFFDFLEGSVAASAQNRKSARPKAAHAFSIRGEQHFVASDAAPGGDGSLKSPWDLQTALNQPASVRPGDVIWLRGGVYGTGLTQFTSKLTGTAAAPIIVRQWRGERATVNGGIAVYGPYTWYWGFEVTSTIQDRGPDRNALDGFDTYEGSAGTKFINLVIHDDSQGIGFWDKAVDAEIYGCIIYDNGFQGTDRGHGHGIYTQNNTGTKKIFDNIIFGQFGWGVHAYGSAQASVQGYQIEGNTVFNNGELSGQFSANILLAGGTPMSRIAVNSNYTYLPGTEGGSQLGWTWSPENVDLTSTGNYFIGGYVALEAWNWQTATFTNNTVYTKELINVVLSLADTQSTNVYKWDQNTYYGTALLRFNGQNVPQATWLSKGVDANSKFIGTAPQGVWVFVRPNAYEQGRGNITIYNWDMKSSVLVDLSSVLNPGDEYEIRDAQNFWGAPVTTGTYDGKPVSVTMTGLIRAVPVGRVTRQPVHTAPGFGSFVVLPRSRRVSDGARRH